MPSRSKLIRNRTQVRTIFVKSVGFALPFLLIACDTTSGTVEPPVRNAQRAGSAIEAALCEGRGPDAVRILTAEPLASPPDRFYKAVALEQSGRAISARREYAALMQSGNRERVFLRCGSTTLANGTVSAEAARRLALLARDLRALDVAPPQTVRLHAGLPSLTDARTTSTAGYTSSGQMTVARPSSTSPLGRWFTHLASYSSYQNAQTNKPTLEKKFPALAGYIDQWEVNVGGGAVRLGVRLDSQSDAKRLCAQVKSNGDYCAVLDTAP
jgi:hypothetical protein